MAKKNKKITRDENGSLVIPSANHANIVRVGTIPVPIGERFHNMIRQGRGIVRMSGIVDEMVAPDRFLEALKSQNDRRHDIVMPNASELNFGFQPKTEESQRGSGFFIAPDYKKFPASSPMRDWFGENKRMFVTPKGMDSAAHLIKRSSKTFGEFANPDARFLNEFNDWFRPNSGKKLIVRTSFGATGTDKNRFVNAFVDGSFNTVSNFDLMAATMHNITKNYGDCIRGVQMLREEGQMADDDNSGYRLVFGDPIMQESASERGDDLRKMTWLMLSYRGSDSGLEDTCLSLSLWRMICSNGAMRHDVKFLRASWNRFDSESKFLFRVGSLISMAGLFGRYMTKKLEELQNTKLTVRPATILCSLREQNLIDKQHFDTSLTRASNSGGLETCYDFLNLLTDSAKVHYSFRRREKAESSAMAVAMQPNSFNGTAIEGFDRRARIMRMADMRKALAK